MASVPCSLAFNFSSPLLSDMQFPPDKSNGFQPLRTVTYRTISISQVGAGIPGGGGGGQRLFNLRYFNPWFSLFPF